MTAAMLPASLQSTMMGSDWHIYAYSAPNFNQRPDQPVPIRESRCSTSQRLMGLAPRIFLISQTDAAASA